MLISLSLSLSCSLFPIQPSFPLLLMTLCIVKISICLILFLSLSMHTQFNYHQVALSSDTPDQSRDTYSHDRPYPLRQRFYIEPKTHSHGAIKCNITVHNSDNTASNQRLASVLVLPYVPPTSKDTTPEPSRAGTPADISLPPSRPSTGPPSPSGNGGLQLRILTPLSSGHETAV